MVGIANFWRAKKIVNIRIFQGKDTLYPLLSCWLPFWSKHPPNICKLHEVLSTGELWSCIFSNCFLTIEFRQNTFCVDVKVFSLVDFVFKQMKQVLFRCPNIFKATRIRDVEVSLCLLIAPWLHLTYENSWSNWSLSCVFARLYTGNDCEIAHCIILRDFLGGNFVSRSLTLNETYKNHVQWGHSFVCVCVWGGEGGPYLAHKQLNDTFTSIIF